MKVAGVYTVPVSQERAYALLQDPVVLARCMPGTEALIKVGEDEYEMKMKVVLASISGLFAGKVRIAEPNPPGAFRLIVEGNGKIGFLNGEGLLTLTPNHDGTEVQYDGEVHVGGTIAGVGQRLLDTTARTIIKRFFKKLNAAAAGTDESEGAGGPTATGAGAEPAAAQTAGWGAAAGADKSEGAGGPTATWAGMEPAAAQTAGWGAAAGASAVTEPGEAAKEDAGTETGEGR